MKKYDHPVRIRHNLPVARKGAGKGAQQAAPYTPVEYPNTLRSLATARIIEVLSEGPIKGPASGWTYPWMSIFYDDTPAMSPNGTWNFGIKEGYARVGLPFQDPIPGYSIAENEVAVGVEMTPFVPVNRRCTSPGLSALRVKVRVNALYMTESDGDVNGTNVGFSVEYSADGGPWQMPAFVTLFGKTMSPYEYTVRFDVPFTTSSLEVRCTRQEGVASAGESNSTFFSSFTEIQYGYLAYDDTALWAVVIDAENFPSIPKRSYLMDGLMILIPSNYDPVSHSYAGEWDGTFKLDWTDNPAWVLYNLLVNERWGLGREVDVDAVDKWSFYEAAVYNDQWIYTPGGTWENRFTCNCVINTRQDAWAVLTAVASSMLATIYFANGTVFISQDRPGSFTRAFGPSDVENGIFEYTGADYRSRFTAAAIQWNDPTDSYNAAVELVQDPTWMAQQGYRETQVAAFGCTSRWQAVRFGRWLLYTGQNETEAVSFVVGLENADLRPGELVAISDPGRVGARLAGRLLDDDGPDTLTLDQSPSALGEVITAWTIYVTSGTDTAGTINPGLTAFSVLEVLPNNQIRVSGKAPGGGNYAGMPWLLVSTAVEPRLFRVTGTAELGTGKYRVLATEYHAEKFPYVDYALVYPEPPFSLIPTGPLVPPTNIAHTEFIYLDGSGFPTFGIVLSWTASIDSRVANYQVELSGPNGDYRRFPLITGIAQEVLSMRQGEWLAVIKAFDNIGRSSLPVNYRFTPVGLTEKPKVPTALYLAPQGPLTTVTWVPTGEIDVVYYWLKWAPQTDGTATWARATTSIARVDRNTTQVNTPTRAGTFMLKPIDALGQESIDWVDAILIPQITNTVHIIDIEEQPDWGGDRGTFWHQNVNELWLPPPDAPEPVPPGVFPGDRGVALNQTPTRFGVYLFQDELDLGMVTASVSLVGIVDGYGTHLGVVMARWVPLASAAPIGAGAHNSMSTWVPLAMAVPLAMGSSAEWDGHIECRIAQADGVTFADWFPLKSAIITGRRFQFRLVGVLYDLSTTMRTVRAAVIVEVPLRSLQGNDVPLDGTGHLTITYAVPFLVTPSVQITARQSLSPGGNIVITESDADHFRVEHRNAAGTATANGSIDYFVQGYGGHS